MKKKIFKYLRSLGNSCTYSGKSKILYVFTKTKYQTRDKLNSFIEKLKNQGYKIPFKEIIFDDDVWFYHK